METLDLSTQPGERTMPSHRTPAALLLFALVAAGTSSAIANAQEATFEFVDSGQALGNSSSVEVALGDLDGDGDLDAAIATFGPNTAWTNDGTGSMWVQRDRNGSAW